MDSTERIPEKLLQHVKEIPAIPDVVVKVMQLTRDPDVTAENLTRVISNDPGLTSNVLRLCNSSYYGLPRTVSSPTQAVMYLGFHAVRNLVLTCSMSRLFDPESVIYGYTQGGLWEHAVSCALTSEMICKRVRLDIHDAAFTAGLLQNIGKIIIGSAIKDTADTIIDLMTNEGLTELNAERQALGFSHEELGSLLADQWNFPEELVHSIRHHHNPEEAKSPTLLSSLVHIADSIVLGLNVGIELEELKYEPEKFALNHLDLSKESFEILREQSKELIEEHLPQFLALD